MSSSAADPSAEQSPPRSSTALSAGRRRVPLLQASPAPFAINPRTPPPNLRADIEYDPDGARLVISPGLRADSDNDGHLTVQDIFHFLTQWFAGNADFDGDGQTTIDDLFAFLASWFAG